MTCLKSLVCAHRNRRPRQPRRPGRRRWRSSTRLSGSRRRQQPPQEPAAPWEPAAPCGQQQARCGAARSLNRSPGSSSSTGEARNAESSDDFMSPRAGTNEIADANGVSARPEATTPAAKTLPKSSNGAVPCRRLRARSGSS
jgi:hypothetical protein